MLLANVSLLELIDELFMGQCPSDNLLLELSDEHFDVCFVSVLYVSSEGCGLDSIAGPMCTSMRGVSFSNSIRLVVAVTVRRKIDIVPKKLPKTDMKYSRTQHNRQSESLRTL